MTSDEIGDVGHSALWVGFAGMFLPSIYFWSVALNAKAGGSSYYFETLTATITSIASLAYLIMATDQGYEGGSDTGDRQFFWIRYVDWTLTTPLMLLDIAGLAGANADSKMLLVMTDILMVLAGVIGANMNEDSSGDHEHYKWAFFALGMMFYMPIVSFLVSDLGKGSGKAGALSKKVGFLTLVLWSAYPVVWVVAEGTEVISPDTEAICYTILDVLAKSVFGLMIVSARDAIEDANRAGSGYTMGGIADDGE